MFQTYDKLKILNKSIDIVEVSNHEFLPFGRIVKDLDITEIIEQAQKIQNPQSGSLYVPSVEEFEKLPISSTIRDEAFGALPIQMGYCYGHNNFLNAAEWHKSSEINIAVTPLVLILGHVWDVEDGKIDSSKFKAFHLPQGTVVEIYATSLHFCPCEVSKSGFGCIVGLPLGTNTKLPEKAKNPLLFRKNKWLIAHMENETLKSKGVMAGISGTNFEIKY